MSFPGFEVSRNLSQEDEGSEMVSQRRRPLCRRVLLVVTAAAAVVAAAGAVEVQGDAASPGVLDELRAEGEGLGKVRVGHESFRGHGISSM